MDDIDYTAPLSQLPDEALRTLALGADALILLNSMRSQGMVRGGPDVDLGRCIDVTHAAGERGLTWSTDEVIEKAIEYAIALMAGSR